MTLLRARLALFVPTPVKLSIGGAVTEVGDKVRFSVVDVFLPIAEGAFVAGAGEEVEGTVVNFSDSGSKVRAFAMVDVFFKQTVIVPVEKLKKG